MEKNAWTFSAILYVYMNPEEIAAFIRKHEGDASPESIKDALVSSGVSEETIDRIWNSLKGVVAKPVMPQLEDAVPKVQPAVVAAAPSDGTWEETLLGNTRQQEAVSELVSNVAPPFVVKSMEAEISPASPAPEQTPLSVVHEQAAPVPIVPVQAPSRVIKKAHTGPRVSVAAVVLASFFLGGGAFAYWSFVEPRLLPAQVFENMSAALTEVHSANYNGSLSLFIDAGQQKTVPTPLQSTAVYDLIKPLLLVQSNGEKVQEIGRVDFDFGGAFDTSDPANYKSTLNAKLSGTLKGTEYKLGMDAWMADNTVYTKFDNVSILDPRLKQIENTWIRADIATIERSVVSQTGASSTTPEVFGVSSQTREKIAGMFRNAQFFTLTDLKSAVTVGGIPAYHYGMEINKEELKKFLVGMFDAAYGSRLPNSLDNPLPSTTVSDVIDILRDVSGEIWIGKEDFLPYEVQLHIDLADPKTSSEIRFNLTLQFSNFNRPLTITIPTNSITMEEVLPLLGVGATTTQVGGQTFGAYDEQRVADVHTLAVGLKLYHDDNGKYPENLEALRGVYVLKVPADPQANEGYAYAVSPDGIDFHLGASLEKSDDANLQLDEDFDSSAVSYVPGFIGADTASCRDHHPGACYDITSNSAK